MSEPTSTAGIGLVVLASAVLGPAAGIATLKEMLEKNEHDRTRTKS